MKKTITLILAFLLLCFGLSACTDLKDNNDDNDGGNENSSPTTAANILVAYFSCTGNTENIAKMIARETGGALHERSPVVKALIREDRDDVLGVQCLHGLFTHTLQFLGD